ncbi:MAG: glycosyltransferase family 2 protein [Desulforhabdus sp.]|jgi:glycosyltransferase involved in cell wall biosynthesis|nr:glycosyltransferase family 2 protein [Desulforhabdus sp.]
MRKFPLVSIIIPTCNDGPVVCQAIDCSLQQTYSNLEIIIVDDGSTDDTEQILTAKYQGRITYVRQENRGPGSARNTGIKHATGKYLQFLDADDLLATDKISMQMRHLDNIADIALSYCDYVCCDINDITVTYGGKSPILCDKNPFNDIMLKWETELSIPMHCFIFDAVFFKKFGIAFDETLQANEDWDCWMNIFALNPTVVFVDKTLAYYRRKKESRSSNRLKMRNSYLIAINKQIQRHRLNNEVVGKLKERKKQIKYFYRNESPLLRTLELFDPTIKKMYMKLVPRRIQRMFY